MDLVQTMQAERKKEMKYIYIYFIYIYNKPSTRAQTHDRLPVRLPSPRASSDCCHWQAHPGRQADTPS